MQVAAGWGVTGLTADTAGRLYDKVRGQLGVAQPPQSLRTDYTEEYFAANAAAGVSPIEPPSTPIVRSALLLSTSCLAYRGLADWSLCYEDP